MKFYFGLSNAEGKAMVMSRLQQFLAVGGDKAKAATQALIKTLENPLGSWEVDSDSYYQALVAFALAKSFDDQNEPILVIADEKANPVDLRREGEWLDYLRQTGIITPEREDEFYDLLLGYGVVRPRLDLSALALATPAPDNDFCL